MELTEFSSYEPVRWDHYYLSPTRPPSGITSRCRGVRQGHEKSVKWFLFRLLNPSYKSFTVTGSRPLSTHNLIVIVRVCLGSIVLVQSTRITTSKGKSKCLFNVCKVYLLDMILLKCTFLEPPPESTGLYNIIYGDYGWV